MKNRDGRQASRFPSGDEGILRTSGTESLEQRLRELQDQVEITDRLHDYCRGLDAMDLDRLVSAFTSDCVVDYGPEPGMRTVGRHSLLQSLDVLMLRWVRTSHHLTNIQIEFITTDQAKSVSYVMAWHEFPGGATTSLYAQYHDTLVREPSGWRIRERRLLMTGCDENWKVPNHRLQRRNSPLSDSAWRND